MNRVVNLKNIFKYLQNTVYICHRRVSECTIEDKKVIDTSSDIMDFYVFVPVRSAEGQL